jgi:hypothetical protein
MRWKIATLVICLWLFSGLILTTKAHAQASSARTEAERLWELAVAAKGGRQRLHQVKSLAVFYEYSRGRPSAEVYAFPDKRWDWIDSGQKSKFPLWVYSMDFEQMVHCVVQGVTREGCESVEGYSKRSFLEGPQLLYLLETTWVKPKLLTASKGTLGFRSVDIVKVQLEQFQISVYLDAKTRLPSRIAYHSNEGGRNLKVGDIFEWYGLSDYREVNGIMLPHLISHTHGSTRQVRYEVNPAYDPHVFTRKPQIAAGPEQWRPKGYTPAKSNGLASSKKFAVGEIQQAIQQLTHPDENVRVEARDKLTQAGTDAIPALTTALSQKQGLNKLHLARVIFDIDENNEAATAVFHQIALDQQEDWRLRRNAALQLIRNNSGIAHLTKMLESSEIFTRQSAVFAFDELTEQTEIPDSVKPAIPVLRHLLSDPDEIVREMSKEVLEQINSRYRPPKKS